MKLFRYIVPLLLLSFVAQAQPPIKDGAICAEFSTLSNGLSNNLQKKMVCGFQCRKSMI